MIGRDCRMGGGGVEVAGACTMARTPGGSSHVMLITSSV